MMAQHMKTWSIAINEDEADPDTAPEALAKILMPSKRTAVNRFRNMPKETPSKDPNAILPPMKFPSIRTLSLREGPYHDCQKSKGNKELEVVIIRKGFRNDINEGMILSLG
jgi:hypothetical protein